MELRQLVVGDASAYWELRLEALKTSPESFGTSYEEAIQRDNPIERVKGNLKVVISFDNGKVVMKEKVRADKRAKKYVMNLLRKDMKISNVPEVAVINCNNTTDARTWKEELLQEFPKLKVIVLPLSACVGVHAGEGTTGLSWVRY